MKNERGITLIILVVTLIIMIILMGVTLDLTLFQNGGLLRKVINATQNQQAGIEEEERKSNSILSSYEEEWGIS